MTKEGKTMNPLINALTDVLINMWLQLLSQLSVQCDLNLKKMKQSLKKGSGLWVCLNLQCAWACVFKRDRAVFAGELRQIISEAFFFSRRTKDREDWEQTMAPTDTETFAKSKLSRVSTIGIWCSMADHFHNHSAGHLPSPNFLSQAYSTFIQRVGKINPSVST